ncbi:MAG TPA: DinB family protein [Thermoanaerobaculia bacterium]|nr:DinB family protein [Thermoanaerobaculia bacterium]
MSKVTLDTVIDHLLAALKEGLDGPGKWGFFSDAGPDAGLAATLKALSASEASRVTGGTSIAAHAYHLVFSLGATVAYMNGDRTPQDWAKSWSVVSVTEPTWKRLQDDLASAFAETKTAIETLAKTGFEPAGLAVGAPAHVAYHLGAIRQKVAFLKAEKRR